MSTHFYKRFMRVAARWPKDPNKSPSRDAGVFLEREVERLFRAGRKQPPQDVALCERRLQSLEQLVSNAHRSNYPHSYKSGVFGLNLDRLHEANSEEGRKAFGLRDKEESFFSGLFRWRS